MARHSSWLGRAARNLAVVSSCAAPLASAINFTPAPPANLDLSQLGRVTVAGNFDSISLYQFEGQGLSGYNTNGSQSVLAQYPTGAFASLANADGSITGMCPFVLQNGTLAGVIVGGNFTSLGGVEAQGVALLNPDTGSITPLPGLSGQVTAVFCQQSTSTVYVGGSFTGASSSNAIMWTTGWTNLPFSGFNGPVTSIAEGPGGSVIFGGSFTGLGNVTAPEEHDLQVIPLTSATILAQNSGAQDGFSDPKNIICKTADQDGPGNTWLLADNAPGFWQATFQFGFIPTKLRLYNTNEQGRGTKAFAFTALPINGILRFTYIDANGNNQTCDQSCPLPQNNQTYQDFHFVNAVGMNQFRIDITEWYGSGGGLAGIELFQDDIFSYAINDFNEPKCDGVSPGTASSTSTGPWNVQPSGQTSSNYLTATLVGGEIDPSQAQVVFEPNIRQAGNYSVTIFTPGCQQDGTCGTRGRVNIKAMLAATGTSTSPEPFSTQLFQTNDFDKYDQIYLGYVDPTSDNFKPSITLTPAAGQAGPLTVVAQRVRYELISSTGGLNGIFQFNPDKASVRSNDFTESPIDRAGNDLANRAVVTALVTQGDDLFVGGNFSAADYANIFSISGDSPTVLPGGGLNGQVSSLYATGGDVYVGGQFTNTRDNSVQGLNGVAVYSNESRNWTALGAGVNGEVTTVLPVQLNLTSGGPEDLVAVSGYFDQVNGFGSNDSFAVRGIALWSPSRGNWLHNLGLPAIAIAGVLSAQTNIPDHAPLFAGSISSDQLGASDAAAIESNGRDLHQLPITIDTSGNSSSSNSSGSATKRSLIRRADDDSDGSVTGVVTAYIYEQNGYNITAIGGHFSATASNGSDVNNLLILNGTSDTVTGFGSGVDTNSTVLAVAAASSSLFAGGNITGTINGEAVAGLVMYDLSAAGYASTQPPALSGNSSVTVNAIAPQPSADNVYVGGSFSSAGTFDCPSLCIWDTARAQWNNPGLGMGGSVVQALSWVTAQRLLVGGSLQLNNSEAPVALYDAQHSSFSSIPGTDALPGPVTAACPAASDGETYWVAGTSSTNGSSYIAKYNGDGNWLLVSNGLNASSTVSSIQIFTLTEDHGSTDFLDGGHSLMVLGDLQLQGYGNASAALFNGTSFRPYLLTNGEDGSSGRLTSVSVQNAQNFFKSGRHKLAVGFVVLIGLAIALALIFLLVVAGIIAERMRRRREGYVRAPTQPFWDRGNMARVPPEELLQGLEKNGGGRL